MSFTSGITCRINPRSTIQSLYFQTGIIGKTVQPVVAVYILRLQGSIAFQRIGCLGNVCFTMNILQAQNLNLIAQNGPDFFQFVSVICSKNQFLHTYIFI